MVRTSVMTGTERKGLPGGPVLTLFPMEKKEEREGSKIEIK